MAPLRLAPLTLAGTQLAFEFQAIPKRPYCVEESHPESPNVWTTISVDATAEGGPDPTVAVPLRIAIPEPQSGTRLYRVRAR